MNKIKVVFFASPVIAVESFLSLITDSDFEVQALVTQPSRPSGRGKKVVDSKIKTEAINAGIPVFEPEKLSKDEDVIQKLQDLEPDFFVTFAYGQILNQKVLDIPKYETINLHASLLPKYRGANPICECLLNGDEITGITTMITVLELDAGDICKCLEIKLDKNSNFETLSKEISALSPNLIKETLKGIYKGEIKPIKQDCTKATFTKKTDKKDKVLDFNSNADCVHNKIRAFCGINTTHFVFNDKLVKVFESEVVDSNEKADIGEILEVNKNGVIINCLQNAVLIKKVKPEGKNLMSAYDWSLGSKIKKGDIIKC